MKKNQKKIWDIKTEYLVIGSNNFWYSVDTTLKDAITTIKIAKRCPDEFADPESGHIPDKPETFYIYKAEEIKRI